MRHSSLYLNWYIRVPNVKYDLRSSGVTYPKYPLTLGEVDLNANCLDKAAELLSQRYKVKPECIFILSEGTSGQNARIIRCIAERDKKKEAIIEYPTYEPLLRQVQEYYPMVKRLERRKVENYRLDAEQFRKIASEKTGLLVLTNPHAPSGAIADRNELEEIITVAKEYGIYVLCDEIYAEFERESVPTIFSVDEELGISTTSFTKAYGLGGLRLGMALAQKKLIESLYADVIYMIGGGSNLVLITAIEFLTKGREHLEKHKQKWKRLRKETEEWLNEKGLEFFPGKIGVTYWVETPIGDTYKWMNMQAIPKHSLALVPGAFFLFKNGYELEKTNMLRLGLGNVNPDKPNLTEAFEAVEKAFKTYAPS